MSSKMEWCEHGQITEECSRCPATSTADALHALKEQFYEAYSGLVNRFLRMMEPVDDDALAEIMLQEMSNVYSRDEDVCCEDEARGWNGGCSNCGDPGI